LMMMRRIRSIKLEANLHSSISVHLFPPIKSQY
jgi:hypothetical protein